mgnify:CR=1 FL=1
MTIGIRIPDFTCTGGPAMLGTLPAPSAPTAPQARSVPLVRLAPRWPAGILAAPP